MRRFIYLILISFLTFSCQEEVFLDLKTAERTPVVEAVWTNTVGLNQVYVSFSRNYYSDEPNEIVKDADVFILDLESDQRIRFRFNEQFESYLPVNNVTGELGKVYELHVIIEGKEYVSQGQMLEPPVLDSLTFAFQEERVFREEGYYLTLYGKIPFIDDNNYRIRIIRNDTLLNRRSDYLLFDDSFGTSILDRGFELSGFAFNEGDRVRLELFRLNLDVYDYLSQLVNLLFNDGGLFSPPPQNPVSNIRPLDGEGEVLGYFMVSPYLNAAVNIVEDESD